MLKLEIVTLLMILLIADSQADVFTVDHARFRGDGEQVFLEVYTSLNRDVVTYKEDSSGWFGSVNFMVEIGHGDSNIATDRWRIDDRIEDLSGIKPGQKLVDIRTYTMLPGEYDITAIAIDSISNRTWKASKSVTISAFSYAELALSDIELAGYLIPPDVLEKFDRGDYGLVPNPDRTFGSTRPFFYYYVEIYPSLDTMIASNYTLARQIIDSNDNPVKIFPPVPFYAGPQPFADVDSISIEHLTTGTYRYSLKISSDRGQYFTRNKKFFIYNEDFDAKPVPRIVDSLEVETELHQVEFLLNRDKFDVAKKLTIIEKAAFLEEFWRRFSDDPTTRQKFKDRIDEADARWSTSRNPGYRSDRGRVYVLYGEPDDREIHTHDIHAKPYEVWNYNNVEGGVMFVFVDRSSLNEFVLAHSTKTGEVFNPNWYQDYVERAGMDSGR